MAISELSSPTPLSLRLAIGAAFGLLGGFLATDIHLQFLVSYWDDPMPLVIASGALGALAGAFRQLRLAGVLATLLLALWLVAGLSPIVPALHAGLVRRDPPRKADAIFVLGSRIRENGDLTPQSMSRLLHAIELAARGQASRLVVSELPEPAGRHERQARRLVEIFGLQVEVLAVGPVSNTRDEAEQVAKLFRERSWTQVLLVTSPVHSKRASLAFEKEGLEVISSPGMEPEFDGDTFPHPRDRIFAAGNVLHERVGLLWYRLRGWI